MKDATATAAMFIDGTNLHLTARALGFEIDYRKLLAVFRREAMVSRAFFYASIRENQVRSNIQPLLDWLDYNGFIVVSKLTKDFVGDSGRRESRCRLGVELAVDEAGIRQAQCRCGHRPSPWFSDIGHHIYQRDHTHLGQR